MTVPSPPWRAGTKAAGRRSEAVRLVLEGRSLAEVRKELALTVVDERCVEDHLLELAAAERRGGQQGPAVRAVQREFGAEHDEQAVPPPPEPPMPPQVAEALAAFRACLGMHPTPEQPGHRQLAWSVHTGRMARVGVVAYTCAECVPISYELCTAGGLMFVRRTDRTKTRPEVSVSEYLPGARVRALWARLLAGQAR
ncbi:hypothetical protein OG320_05315 [Microbispora sp. NBC_01189]|uniref:hypothetical protein n=1 Tax=Microbispora sp. NBC_01189 TaxID=2903583 RepID=UPI002E129B28|nr:hypothetical protein OG320_05315 [Microbispora sp. NBC_01189]